MGRRPVFASLTWFLARFVTHWCAPTSSSSPTPCWALSAARRLGWGESQKDVSLRMIKRGGILLLLEALVVSPAFGAPPFYFGVIACIGVCFIIFSVYRLLPPIVIMALSLLVISAHPFLNLNWIPNDNPAGWYLRVILHEPNHDWPPFTGLYPIIPWIGVMGLGWFFGSYLTGLEPEKTKDLKVPLSAIGCASIALFIIVRQLNGYRNLLSRRGNTLMDWLYVAKYPPSLAFLLWTLGGMSLFMAFGLHLEQRHGFDKGFTGVILSFGRNPLFFYLAHLWLYRVRPGWVARPVFYLDIYTTIGFWLVGLVVLWRLCLRYEKFKKQHPGSILQYI